MKIKLNSSVLVIAFIIYLVLTLGIFALLYNSAASLSAYILLIVLLVIVTVFFIFSMQLRSKIAQLEKEKETQKVEKSEVLTQDEAIATEKIVEKEIDIKKLIPKEKVKFELFTEELLKNFSDEFQAVQSILYVKDAQDVFKCHAKYAYYSELPPSDFKSGEALTGQAVKSKSVITLSNIPDNYIVVASGLGKGLPAYLTFVPIIAQDDVIGLIEFATFKAISETTSKNLSLFSEKVADSIIKFIKNIK